MSRCAGGARAREAHEPATPGARLARGLRALELEAARRTGGGIGATGGVRRRRSCRQAREGARALRPPRAARAAGGFAPDGVPRRDLEAEKSRRSRGARPASIGALYGPPHRAVPVDRRSILATARRAPRRLAERDVRHLRDALAAMETRAEKPREAPAAQRGWLREARRRTRRSGRSGTRCCTSEPDAAQRRRCC